MPQSLTQNYQQLCKANSYGLEILGEYDEFFVKKDETTQEFVVSGKNKNEQEEIIKLLNGEKI